MAPFQIAIALSAAFSFAIRERKLWDWSEREVGVAAALWRLVVIIATAATLADSLRVVASHHATTPDLVVVYVGLGVQCCAVLGAPLRGVYRALDAALLPAGAYLGLPPREVIRKRTGHVGLLLGLMAILAGGPTGRTGGIAHPLTLLPLAVGVALVLLVSAFEPTWWASGDESRESVEARRERSCRGLALTTLLGIGGVLGGHALLGLPNAPDPSATMDFPSIVEAVGITSFVAGTVSSFGFGALLLFRAWGSFGWFTTIGVGGVTVPLLLLPGSPVPIYVFWGLWVANLVLEAVAALLKRVPGSRSPARARASD